METDITLLTSLMIILLAYGLDLLRRQNAWQFLRWPWIIIVIGRVVGLKIVAPIDVAMVSWAEGVAGVAVLGCAGFSAARWLLRRHQRRASSVLPA